MGSIFVEEWCKISHSIVKLSCNDLKISCRQLGTEMPTHKIFQTRLKIASLSRQEPLPTGATKWATALRFAKI